MASKTVEEIRTDIIEYTKVQLGPIYKESDEQVLINLEHLIEDEAFQVGNILSVTPGHLVDMMSIIVQCMTIAYENRGVEGQTRQGELGQENHFIDWHQYLQDEVVSHGKRYVI